MDNIDLSNFHHSVLGHC